MPPIKDVSLVEIASGAECIVSRVRTHELDKLRYIASLNLVPGEAFHLLSCAPFKGPLRLRMQRAEHVIGYELATSLWVEVSIKRRGE